jgi:hypothetical protein
MKKNILFNFDHKTIIKCKTYKSGLALADIRELVIQMISCVVNLFFKGHMEYAMMNLNIIFEW